MSFSSQARKYQQLADQSRRETVLLAHLPLVKHVLGRMEVDFPRELAAENLEVAGLYGLLEALPQLHNHPESEFPRLSRPRIERAVWEEIRRGETLTEERIQRIESLIAFWDRVIHPIRLESWAREIGWSSDRVIESLTDARFLHHLDATRYPDWFGFTAIESALTHWAQSREMGQLAPLLASLETVPIRLLTLFFPEDLRLREVSEILGLSRIETMRIYRTTLFELAEQFRTRSLRVGDPLVG